jgi:ribosomal protein S18 acetylase RimI-like enzyme
MNLLFRDACVEDLPAIVAMLADDDLGKSREQMGGELAPAYCNAFEEMRQGPYNRLIVAEQGGKITGCLQLTVIPGLSRQGAKRALVEGVRVSVSARGQGIGEKLMQYAIAEARAAGCKLVQLTSDKRRTRAHEFYSRLGFAQSHLGFKLELS